MGIGGNGTKNRHKRSSWPGSCYVACRSPGTGLPRRSGTMSRPQAREPFPGETLLSFLVPRPPKSGAEGDQTRNAAYSRPPPKAKRLRFTPHCSWGETGRNSTRRGTAATFRRQRGDRHDNMEVGQGNRPSPTMVGVISRAWAGCGPILALGFDVELPVRIAMGTQNHVVFSANIADT
jgi:hypothetical protein